MKTIMAIGGHIGDMKLTCGCVLATQSLKGDKIVTVALTKGERGNPPNITEKEYGIQKVNEALEFARMLKGESIVFDYPDGELLVTEEVKFKLAQVIRDYHPDIIFTHFRNSLHKDHANTYKIVQDALFYAGTDMGERLTKERVWPVVYYCENWEDSEGFIPYVYIDCSQGYDLWCEAIKKHWFIMNSPWFKYYDYYTHLTYVRGALNNTKHAQAFTIDEYNKNIKMKGL